MDQKGKTILIAVTLDTKGEEALYLKELIRRRGHNPLVLDFGISGAVPFQADFTREEVALATGRSLEEIRKATNTYADLLSELAMGARYIVQDLLGKGKIDGLLAIGGGLGTNQALITMQDLPLSLPKLVLSTVAFAPGTINSEMVKDDQAMMQSVADLWGVNGITRISLQRAVGAICGMVEAQEEGESEKKSMVAISALGVHGYVDRCKSVLLENGYEGVVFHSIGRGGLEKLVRQGYFDGTLDLSCYELVSYVCGGIVKGAAEKITAACEMGIPQVVSSGGLDFFPLFATQPVPEELRGRTMLVHGTVRLVKTSSEEQEKVATLLAERINKAAAPIAVLIPLDGFSRLDHGKEMPFHEVGAAQRFIGALKEEVSNPLVTIEEIEAHINDPVFAERATALLLARMR